MLGQTQQALDCLKQDGSAQLDAETKIKMENLSNALIEESKISPKVAQLSNQAAVLMCSGNFDQAKVSIDQVLEQLELKLQTTETESKHMIPSYLVNLLIYFFVKTSKLK